VSTLPKCRDCDQPRANSQLDVCAACFDRLNVKIAEQTEAERAAAKAEHIASMKYRFGNLLAQIPLETLRDVIAGLPPPAQHPSTVSVTRPVPGFGDLQLTLQSNAAPGRLFWTAWRVTRE